MQRNVLREAASAVGLSNTTLAEALRRPGELLGALRGSPLLQSVDALDLLAQALELSLVLVEEAEKLRDRPRPLLGDLQGQLQPRRIEERADGLALVHPADRLGEERGDREDADPIEPARRRA